MRTFVHEQTNVFFNYNSDLSGDVLIGRVHSENVVIPGEALLEFIGQWVIGERIARLEQLTGRQALLGKR